MVRSALAAAATGNDPGPRNLFHAGPADRPGHLEWDGVEPPRRHDRAGRDPRALAREVLEEACAHVVYCRYIGCQRVEDIDAGGPPYYQTRFWARAELDEFRPEHETT